jgi:glycosyltransferase involved in cell wall biosynthesis
MVNVQNRTPAACRKPVSSSRKLHIAMLGTLPPLKGLSSYCLSLTRALAAKIKVTFLSFSALYPAVLYPGGSESEEDTFPHLNSSNLTIRKRLRWNNPFSWIAEPVRVDADLLHVQWWSLPLAPLALCIMMVYRLRGRPVIMTVHNVVGHEHEEVYRAALHPLLLASNHFIVHTQRNRDQLMTIYGIPARRISVVPHGRLDFRRRAISRSEARQELNIGNDKKVILLFGAIRAYKGVDIAIDAFSMVSKELPEATLLIAGSLWQEWEPYQERIEKLGISSRVNTFLEYIPSRDVPLFFQATDLVVLPYRKFDSQSGVGSMAVAFDKPMIVSDVGGLPDLVEDPRCVIAAGDAPGFARCMIRCLSAPSELETMSLQAKRISNSLDWSRISDTTIALYHRLLQRQQAERRN